MWPLVGASVLAISTALRNRSRQEKDDVDREQARNLLQVILLSVACSVDHVIRFPVKYVGGLDEAFISE